MRYRAIAAALGCALIPGALSAESCRTLATIDPHSGSATNYTAVPIGDWTPDATLRLELTRGELQYVALHWRYEGGIWETGYKGPQTSFPGTHEVPTTCRAETKCTHIVVMLNAEHRRVEPGDALADVLLCTPSQQTSSPMDLDSTWTAPMSGWQIDLPTAWIREVDDDPNGGTGMFTAPDGNLVVGVSTVTPPKDVPLRDLADTAQRSMFYGATPLSDAPLQLAGLTGFVRRYEWDAPGGRMAAIAAYLPSGPRVHVLWATTLAALSSERMPDAVSILNSFRTLSAAPDIAPGRFVFDNWNTGGCDQTTRSEFALSRRTSVLSLDSWRQWEKGETRTAAQLVDASGRVLQSLTLTRGECHPSMPEWCHAATDLDRVLEAGRYAMVTPAGRICQNAASGNNGYVRVMARAEPETGGNDGPAVAPPRLVMLTVGDHLQRPTPDAMSRDRFSVDAPAIYVDGFVVGQMAGGQLLARLIHIGTGSVLLRESRILSPADLAKGFHASHAVPRPSGGWPPGAYLLTFSLDGAMMGQRMFLVEEAR